MDLQDLLILTQSIDEFARIVVAIITTRIKRVSALDKLLISKVENIFTEETFRTRINN